MEKQNKKEILATYKERKIIGGVYLIKNNENNKALLLSTTDLQGSKNRFEFSQKTGSCVTLKLQKEWVEFGSNAFTMEVLEELNKNDTQTLKEFGDDIKMLEEIWLEKLDANNLY